MDDVGAGHADDQPGLVDASLTTSLPSCGKFGTSPGEVWEEGPEEKQNPLPEGAGVTGHGQVTPRVTAAEEKISEDRDLSYEDTDDGSNPIFGSFFARLIGHRTW